MDRDTTDNLVTQYNTLRATNLVKKTQSRYSNHINAINRFLDYMEGLAHSLEGYADACAISDQEKLNSLVLDISEVVSEIDKQVTLLPKLIRRVITASRRLVDYLSGSQ